VNQKTKESNKRGEASYIANWKKLVKKMSKSKSQSV
jgi:hypothetical protein